MKTPTIGKKLKSALELYSEHVVDFYVEDDYYGTEYGEDNIYSVWIHMNPETFDVDNEVTIVHEHNQNTAVRELKLMVDLIKRRKA